MKQQFAVIGLGRFGGSICKTLSDLGHEVLAIDINENKVNQYADIVTQAVQMDSTDEQALRDIGIRNMDHVIVAIGDDIQASILTTLILKDLNVPYITVKAQNDYHERVLAKIGATKIVHPERDMGVRIAHHLLSKNVMDYIELSPDYSLVEIKAGEKMVGKSLLELNIRAKYGCNIMAIKSKDGLNISPKAEDVIQKDDILVVIGANKDISRFEENEGA
ncbi:TrkA-N domain protein [Caldalkalibacillus thermarum TA2.A1]|uniref:TrkA family potassium uptake protein n=1 Tax=Caldalkalibacillus thermarum (strain TA2.A1) TaxID=986075 RepID=F5L7Q0_CALTT|nr:TrkA family potassium uptake protein [Caldalkalibacillus thermarum]EGL82626.1 TrkA-N domain protein [Caldalkalibacillus thermarum TA2.A1]QZT33333.1 TrkA family potassium uptake protein [Caldalkalibacillus thermarum TA2.A1]GGK20689.1 ktr system potassium uptake protein C [Caldalkalibacillus thermarum]